MLSVSEAALTGTVVETVCTFDDVVCSRSVFQSSMSTRRNLHCDQRLLEPYVRLSAQLHRSFMSAP